MNIKKEGLIKSILKGSLLGAVWTHIMLLLIVVVYVPFVATADEKEQMGVSTFGQFMWQFLKNQRVPYIIMGIALVGVILVCFMVKEKETNKKADTSIMMLIGGLVAFLSNFPSCYQLWYSLVAYVIKYRAEEGVMTLLKEQGQAVTQAIIYLIGMIGAALLVWLAIRMLMKEKDSAAEELTGAYYDQNTEMYRDEIDGDETEDEVYVDLVSGGEGEEEAETGVTIEDVTEEIENVVENEEDTTDDITEASDESKTE